MNHNALVVLGALAVLLAGCASQEDRRSAPQQEALRSISGYVAGVWEVEAGALPADLAPEDQAARLTLLPSDLRRADETNETADYAVIQPRSGPAVVVPYVLNAGGAPEARIQLWIGDARFEVDRESKQGELTLRPIRPMMPDDAPITLRAVEGPPSVGSPGPSPARDPDVHRRAFGRG